MLLPPTAFSPSSLLLPLPLRFSPYHLFIFVSLPPNPPGPAFSPSTSSRVSVALPPFLRGLPLRTSFPSQVVEVVPQWAEEDRVASCTNELQELQERTSKRPPWMETGISKRLIDGLQDRQDTGFRGVLFPHGYRAAEPVLPFCAALPDHQRFSFDLASVVGMVLDSVMKVHEIGRQEPSHNHQHVVAIFVYTYELVYADDKGGQTEGAADNAPCEDERQIYRAMNKAMREQRAEDLSFWRPLLWHLDQALQTLQSCHVTVYRGIKQWMQRSDYQQGRVIRWPAFSSASRSESVALAFAKEGEGGRSLFVIEAKSAKDIHRYAQYPDEEEVCG